MWRKFWVWVFISVLMFGGAGWLTLYITAVDGHTPFDFFNPNADRNTNDDTIPQAFHGQLISILQAPSDNPDDTGFDTPVRVEYRTDVYGDVDADSHKTASIFITVPAHRKVRIILNNVGDFNSGFGKKHRACVTLGSVPDEKVNEQVPKASSSTAYFDIKPTKKSGRNFYIMTLPSADSTYVLQCWMSPDAGKETFTKRTMQFSFFVPEGKLSSDGRFDADNETYTDPAYYASDFSPVSAITLDVSFRGADRFTFNGGTVDMTASDSDSMRKLVPMGFTNIEWEDVISQQLRDLCLIIIGTLLAIGVTTVIEAIRPLIDGPGEKID